MKILIEILSFLIFNIFSHNVFASKTVEIPNYVEMGDYTDLLFVQKTEDKIFEGMWDADYPVLPERADECKDVLFDMRECGIGNFEEYALAVSEFSWAYIPLLCTNPDFTPYKKVIEANFKFKTHGKCECTNLVKALKNVKPAIVQALNLALDSAAINSECSNEDPCKKACLCKNKKRKIDVSYNAYKFWDTTGSLYPCIWQQCAMDLSKCNSDIENVISLMGATFAVPYMAFLEKSFIKTMKYQIFSMSGTEPIDSDFCEAFLADIERLREKIPRFTDNAIRKAIKSTGCK